jgi:hypothetical protein
MEPHESVAYIKVWETANIGAGIMFVAYNFSGIYFLL